MESWNKLVLRMISTSQNRFINSQKITSSLNVVRAFVFRLSVIIINWSFSESRKFSGSIRTSGGLLWRASPLNHITPSRWDTPLILCFWIFRAFQMCAIDVIFKIAVLLKFWIENCISYRFSVRCMISNTIRVCERNAVLDTLVGIFTMWFILICLFSLPRNDYILSLVSHWWSPFRPFELKTT